MKRIALIFILILTFNAVFSQAKIGTDGSVEPTGNFPAMKDEFLKGSMRVVADTTARNAIPSVFRKNGMLVYDQALKTLWVLDSSVSPIWKNYLANATVDSTTYATRARLYKVADSLASVNAATYQPIGSYLTLADSATFSTKAYRQKGVDSVSALISQRITDSLRALVRLRASGSGGIQLQNSNGTNVADFGTANTTNGSIAGGWNVGGNLSITGTSGFTGKSTFSDSIVGVNQRLSGSASIIGNVGIGANNSFGNLDIYNSSTSSLYTRTPSSSIRIVSTGGINYIQSGSSTNNSSAPLVFSSMNNSTEWARFDSTGKFGLGTSSPSTTLHVIGDGTFSSKVFSNTSYSNTSDLGFISSSTIPGINLRTTGSNGRLSILTNYINSNISSFLVGTGSSNPTTEIMRFNHSSNEINLYGNTSVSGALTANGKATFTDSIVGVNQRLSGNSIIQGSLGININPTASLHVNGNAIVSGTLNGNSAAFTSIISGTAGLQDPTAGTNSGTSFALNNSVNNAYGIGTNAALVGQFDMFFQTGAVNGGGFRFYKGTNEIAKITSVGGLNLSGALTANGKATFTDSIVGVNQRLSGNLAVSGTVTAFSQLGVGTTAPNGSFAAEVVGTFPLLVNSTSTSSASSFSSIRFYRQSNTTNSGNGFAISLNNSSSSVSEYAYIGGLIESNTAGAEDGAILFSPAVSGTRTERARLNKNGFSVTGTLSSTGALTATAQGNNIAVTVDSTTITTSGYTLVLGDAGKFFRVKNGSTALTVTIPANSSVAFPVGTLIGIQQQGTAQITIAGASGVQIESEGSLTKTAGQNAGIYLMKTSGDIWLLVGNRG